MKGYLFRAVFKRYWKLLLSIMLVSALGYASMAGLSSGYLSLKTTLEDYMRDGGIPDAVITTVVTNREKMDALLAVPGIEEVNARLTANATLISPQGRYLSIRAFSYAEDEFQQFIYWEQADAVTGDTVLLEYNFAVDNDIHPGDTVQVMVNGDYRPYTVAGIVSRPETFSVQPVEEINDNNQDFGYVYAPRFLLGKESEAERSDTMRQLDEKNSELGQAEQTAHQEYRQALAELDSAEAELNDKKAEFAQTYQELAEQLAELEETREELIRQEQVLGEKKAEAESGQMELDGKKAQAQEKEAELKQGQAELNEKRVELEEAGQIFAEQRIAALEKQKQALAQGIALQRTKDALLSGKAELEKARAEAIEKRGDLHTTRRELIEKRDALKEALRLLRQAKAYLSRYSGTVNIQDALREAGGLIPSEWAQMQEQLRSMLGSYAPSGTITEAVLDEAVSRVSALYDQADRGIERIDDGLQQIRDGLKLAKEKELELDDGLMQAQAGEEQLNGALRQIADGFSQLSQASDQIAEARAEIGRYQARIDEGWEELNGGLAQMADYQAELDEGFAQIEAGQAELSGGLAQIEDGKRQISEAVAEAQRQLADGEEQLAVKQAEVECGWIEAMSEFSDMKNELQNAYDQLAEWEGYEALCNQFLLRFSTDAPRTETLKAAEAALGDVSVKSAVLYEDSRVKVRIGENLEPMETMMIFVPLIFFGVALVTVYLFMALIIRQSRREIGILRALGFSRGRIVLFFRAVNLLASLGAVALGTATSLWVNRFIGDCFRNVFPLYFYTNVFDGGKAALSAVLTVAVGQAATLISGARASNVPPSEAMSRRTPNKTNISPIAARVTRGASPLVKFSVLSLLRNPLRFLFSVVCLSASMMLIFASFSLLASKDAIITRLFEERIHYDCQIFLRENDGGALERALREQTFVSSVEPLDYYVGDFSLNGKTETAVLNAMQEHTKLISIRDKNGRYLPILQEGVVMERHLAEKLGAKAGDTVQVNGVPMEITAFSDQCVSRFQCVSPAQAEALGEPDLCSVICRLDEAHEKELMEFLIGQDNYFYSVFTRMSRAAYEKIFEAFTVPAWLIVGFAIGIGLVVVINTANTNLLEQKRQLSVLRALGFQHGEISRCWFVQSLLYFLCSLALGLPGGMIVAKVAMLKMESPERTFPFINALWVHALTAVLVLGYIAFSHLVTMRGMKKWNIVENVKEKE